MTPATAFRALVALIGALLTAGTLPGCAPDSPCPRSIACRLLAHAPETVPLRVVAYGTSLTADGAWLAEVAAAVEAEFPGAARFVNAAESARYSAWGLDNLDARVLAEEPDVVFLEFAVNDAYTPYATDIPTSVANLEELIDRILMARPGADIVILTTNVVLGAHADARPNLSAYYAAWRDVAEREGLTLADEEPAWALLLERSPATFDRLVPDGIHPSYEGHALVGAPIILDAMHGVTTDPEALVQHVLEVTAASGP